MFLCATLADKLKLSLCEKVEGGTMSSTVARIQVYLIVEMEIEMEIERLQEREVRNGVMAFLKLLAGWQCFI